MSVSTKKKYVTQEISELILPEEPNFVARIVAGRGNNLHEVENCSGEHFLVSMPTKFRKNVWVKRGDYVLCQPIVEGDKVKAEITNVLYKGNIKYIKSHNLWPKQFDDPISEAELKNASDKNAVDFFIDKDMLPSSDSDSDSEEENEQQTDLKS